jgi:hypothetical protein
MKQDIIQKIQHIVKNASSDSREACVEAFKNIKQAGIIDPEFVDANAQGLLSDDWSRLEQKLNQNQFISENGYGLIIAPFRVWRPGVKNQLSALFCQKANVRIFPANQELITQRYGNLEDTPIIPIDIEYSCGNIGGKTGENFIVPSGWVTMPNAASSSPFFDLQGSQEKIDLLANDSYLYRLFDNDTASCLVKFRNDTPRVYRARLWEYSTHELGHAQGDFSNRIKSMKGRMDLAAFEEWRADGVMVDIVDMHVKSGDITADEAKDVLISNFLTRFGTDIARNNGKMDHDLLTSYWISLSLENTGLLSYFDEKIHLHGDVDAYDFWKNLYSDLRKSALVASSKLNDEGYDPIRDSIPKSSHSLNEFVDFVKGVLDSDTTNKSVTPKMKRN